MTLALDPAEFLEPLSGDLPCGEDLDEAGDDDYLDALARVESQLPASFLTRDADGKLQHFDHSKINVGRESGLLLGLLGRTRDLRVLTLLARLVMLDRDLHGFRQALAAVAGLLETQWDAVHPRGQSDDFGLRADALQALGDNPTVILPLQHLTLFASRRLGPVNFRMLMVADGEVPPAGDDAGPDRAAIERALDDADAEALEPLRADLAAITGNLDRIAAAMAARGGRRGVVDLGRLGDLVRLTRAFLDRSATAPTVPDTAAPEPDPSAPDTPAVIRGPAAGAIASTADAAAALAAAAGYLRRHEPSSPAEVLVRQAQGLLGKSFVDVMQILMPDHAPQAGIVIGAGRGLRLSFGQLVAVPDDGDAGETSDGEESDDGGEPAHAPTFHVRTRAEAVALLREVCTHFRRAEPASPIPLLLDKATNLVDRDFLTILKEVLADARSD